MFISIILNGREIMEITSNSSKPTFEQLLVLIPHSIIGQYHVWIRIVEAIKGHYGSNANTIIDNLKTTIGDIDHSSTPSHSIRHHVALQIIASYAREYNKDGYNALMTEWITSTWKRVLMNPKDENAFADFFYSIFWLDICYLAEKKLWLTYTNNQEWRLDDHFTPNWLLEERLFGYNTRDRIEGLTESELERVPSYKSRSNKKSIMTHLSQRFSIPVKVLDCLTIFPFSDNVVEIITHNNTYQPIIRSLLAADYCTLTHSRIEARLNTGRRGKAERWFSQLFTDDDTREYVMWFLTSTLISNTVNNHVYVFLGECNNGKSALMKTLDKIWLDHLCAAENLGRKDGTEIVARAKIIILSYTSMHRVGAIRKVNKTAKIICFVNHYSEIQKITSPVVILPMTSTWIHNAPASEELQYREKKFQADRFFDQEIPSMAEGLLSILLERLPTCPSSIEPSELMKRYQNEWDNRKRGYSQRQ